MITLQSTLAFALVIIQLCVGILNMINLIQSIVHNHRKEKRTQRKESHELEYHTRNIQHHEKSGPPAKPEA